MLLLRNVGLGLQSSLKKLYGHCIPYNIYAGDWVTLILCSDGNCTIQFIESFFKLKGNKDVDDVSRMYILSGNSIIEFDGTYRLSDLKDDNGVPRGIISFNSSGSLLDKPDTR